MNRRIIYMDYNASTPVDARVVQAMLPYFTEHFGNPSSGTHEFGWKAEAAVDIARKQVAHCIGAQFPEEILFTSGATESVNLAVKGVAEAAGAGRIITAKTEHKAVLDSCYALEKKGFDIQFVSVDEFGFVNLEELESLITPDTFLVSIMAANNETGVIQDIEAIGSICKKHNVLFHTDATQAVGKIPFDVVKSNVDLCSFTAHKFYGPKGVGCLYRKKTSPKIEVVPQIDGGGHEFGLRSGTLNVPGIVGLSSALQLAVENLNQEISETARLRDTLYNGLSQQVGDVVVNGPHPLLDSNHRLSANLNISILGAPSSVLMMGIKDIAFSAAAACGTTGGAYSHVLKAMNVGNERGETAIRLSFGRFTTDEEVEYTIERIVQDVLSIRKQVYN
ncbi:MAG: cysteine desulfurase [Candidatus Kapabacteria bacterium]|nr:cysteine desulfurase [Candidatus Kapabacteria bacterium]